MPSHLVLMRKDFNENIYFKMIKLKTASLISSSAEVGALLSTNNSLKVKKLKTKTKNKFNMPLNSLMNLTKLNKILKKK